MSDVNINFPPAAAPTRGVTAGEVEDMVIQAKADVEGQVSAVVGQVEVVNSQLAETTKEIEGRGVPIEKFGAVGDLITDDSQAFKDALASLSDGSRIVLSGNYLVKDPSSLTGASTPKKNITFSGQGKFTKIKIKPNITSEVVNGNLTGLTYSVRDYYEEFTVSALGWVVQKIQLSTGKIFEYIAIADKTQIPSTLISGVFLRGKTSRIELEVASVDKNDPDGVGTARIYLFEAINKEKGGSVLTKNASNLLIEDLQAKIQLGYSNKYLLDFGTNTPSPLFAANRKLTQSGGKTARIDGTATYTDKNAVVHNLVLVDSFSAWQDVPFYNAKPIPLEDNQDVEIKTYTVSSASFGSLNKSENINFENIIFDGANYEVGLKFDNGNTWNILYTYAAKNVSIRNCIFKNSMMGGIQIGYAGNGYAAYSDFPDNVVIDNCSFENNGRGDIEIIRAKKVSISDCYGDGSLDIEPNGSDILDGISISGCYFKRFTPFSPNSITSSTKISAVNSVFQTVVSQVGGLVRMTNCFIHSLGVYDASSSSFSNCSINRFGTPTGKFAVSFYNSDIYDLPRTNSGSQNEGTLDAMEFIGCTIDLSLVDDITNNTFAINLTSSKLKSLTRFVRITRSNCGVSNFKNSEVANVELYNGNGVLGYKIHGSKLLLKSTAVLKQVLYGIGDVEIIGSYLQASISMTTSKTVILDCVLDGVSKPKLYSRDGLIVNGLKTTLSTGIDWGWVQTCSSPALLKFNNVSVSKNIPVNLGITNGAQVPSISNVAEGCTVFYMDDIVKHAAVLYNNAGAIGIKYINYV